MATETIFYITSEYYPQIKYGVKALEDHIRKEKKVQ
jgi:hypothetical protein